MHPLDPFAEPRKFCESDRWDPKKRTDHWRYTKRFPDGRTLRTKVSFGSGDLGDPGLFAAILREQLQVTEEEFWRVVRDGGPARRPDAPIAAPTKPTPFWPMLPTSAPTPDHGAN